VVTRYNQWLLAELRKEGTLDQILQVEPGSKAVPAGNIEQLDRELTRAKLEAEHHCRKLKAGGVDWCPLLTQAIYVIQYWKGWTK